MKRHSIRRAVTFILAALAWVVLGVWNRLYAQGTSNNETADELIRSAQRSEMLGYILGGAGILVIIGGVIYTIFADRKKKTRKRKLDEDR